MGERMRLGLAAVLALAMMSFAALAQQTPAAETAVTRAIDPEIAGWITAAKAFDNHAHPVLPPPEEKTDRGFDALPVDNMEPETDVVAWRADNPQLLEAWKALWGFDGGKLPLDAEGMKRLEAARARVRAREGEKFDEWVLDQAGIGTMAANRVSMSAKDGGPGIQPPRFRWVPYVDALLFPLENSGLAGATPDRKQFFPLEERVRARYLAAAGLKAAPATLAEYLAKVVTPTLERQKAGGAIAEKFEIAYLRGFDFADVPQRGCGGDLREVGGQGCAGWGGVQAAAGLFIPVYCGGVRAAGDGGASAHDGGGGRLLWGGLAGVRWRWSRSLMMRGCARRSS